MGNAVTALYDCRSKQDYIYRTNRIREISGASDLLASVYYLFVQEASRKGLKIKSDWKSSCFSLDAFYKSDYDGEIIYSGGGNLYMIYKDRSVYVYANKIFSRMLIDKSYTISIIASCTETTGNFGEDRKQLYRENLRRKNLGTFSFPCNALPIVQMDRTTFMPVVKKSGRDLSRESMLKEKFYKEGIGDIGDIDPRFKDLYPEKEVNSSLQVVNLDDNITEKGKESLLAVIYIDGNGMGEKVKNITQNINDYDECVKRLREFSVDTDRCFVQQPINAIDKLFDEINETSENGKKYGYRLVIGGGDEITLICNARHALKIVKRYFEVLSAEKRNSACAGIAVFHSHAPFADVYKIAEGCCESGKRVAHLPENKDKSYVDFHFCHAGITGDLEVIRERQEENITSRPYEYGGSLDEFIRVGSLLKKAGRSNVKALSEAIVKGESYYLFEINRINSTGKLKKDEYLKPHMKKMIYDVSVVYDIWFGKSGEGE
jgi:hypothetical protein